VLENWQVKVTNSRGALIQPRLHTRTNPANHWRLFFRVGGKAVVQRMCQLESDLITASNTFSARAPNSGPPNKVRAKVWDKNQGECHMLLAEERSFKSTYDDEW
jgi:hypothetical protein